MDTSTIDEPDVGPHLTQHAPLTDDTEVHHAAADTEEKLLSSQRKTMPTDIDVQSQLQNWNFHTVRNKLLLHH